MLRKVILAVVLILLVALGGLVWYFYLAHPKMRPAPNLQAPKTPAAIERGRYLVEH